MANIGQPIRRHRVIPLVNPVPATTEPAAPALPERVPSPVSPQPRPDYAPTRTPSPAEVR